MNHRQPQYEIVERLADSVTIRDVGPWDRFMTVTNGAEAVVDELVQSGIIREGQRLFYYDSENILDEIVVKQGRFAGFKPGPARRQ